MTDTVVNETDLQTCFEDLCAKIAWTTDGLVPIIAQDHNTKDILMMAWANREALWLTCKMGQVHYYSRSRQTLWRKGETSGNTQTLVRLRLDCDGDCLLADIHQVGSACHTGADSCFYREINPKTAHILHSIL